MQAVEEQKKTARELEEEVTTANARIEQINSELSDVVEQLGEAKVHIYSVFFLIANTLNILHISSNNSCHI